jgi:hypothetical protein
MKDLRFCSVSHACYARNARCATTIVLPSPGVLPLGLLAPSPRVTVQFMQGIDLFGTAEQRASSHQCQGEPWGIPYT